MLKMYYFYIGEKVRYVDGVAADVLNDVFKRLESGATEHQ